MSTNYLFVLKKLIFRKAEPSLFSAAIPDFFIDYVYKEKM